MSDTTHSAALIVPAIVVVVVALSALSIVGGAAQTPYIDTFSDADTNIERADWSGWDDQSGVFGVTGDAIRGSASGVYEPTGVNQYVNASHSAGGLTTNTSWRMSVVGLNGNDITHDWQMYDDNGNEILGIHYRERAFGGRIFVTRPGGFTQIGTFNENADNVQRFIVDWDFPNDQATVYLNGSAHGPFNLKTSASEWAEVKLVSGVFSSNFSGSPRIRVDDFGVSGVNAEDPAADNASASPQGGAIIQSSPATLEIDVSDPDFAKSVGEQVTVEWYKDGSKVDTEIIQSNQTVTTSAPTTTAGDHTWHVELEDSFGLTAQSDTFTYDTPSKLTVRPESNSSALIDNAKVELVFYFDDQPVIIEQRNTTNGTINMAGLPTNRPFVVAASAPGYQSRRTYIRDLFTSQTIYLLNNSANSVQPTFQLRDFSGAFPAAETVLLAQNAINESWQTVEGDFFGGDSEMTATLAFNERHRLVLLNTETGETEIFNAFFPTTSREQTLTVSAGSIDVDNASVSTTIRPQVARLQQGNVTVSGSVSAPRDNLRDYALVAWANDSGSRTRLKTATGALPGGSDLSLDLNLSNNASERIEVRLNYSLQDGTVVTEWRNYSVGQSYTSATLLDVLGAVPARFANGGSGATTLLAAIIASVAAVGVASRYPMSTEVIGFVMVVILGMFFVVGWFPAAYFAVSGVAWTVAAGVRRGL